MTCTVLQLSLQVRASVRTLSEGIRYKIDTFSDVFAFNIFASSSYPPHTHTHTCGVEPPQQLYEIPTPGECGVCGWLGPGCGPYRSVLPVLLGLRPFRRGHQQEEGGGLVFGFDREMAALLLLLRQRRESNLFSHMHGLRCCWFSGWYRLGVYLRPAREFVYVCRGRNVCVLRLTPSPPTHCCS